MLYVSRNSSARRVYVYDTDDGKEQEILRSELMDIVASTGLVVQGCSVSDEGGWTVIDVAPYQLPEEAKPIQAKTKLVKKVDVRTWHGAISHIGFDANDFSEPVSIRLSDFARNMEDCCIAAARDTRNHVLTLVVDDKMNFIMDRSLWSTSDIHILGKGGLGVAIDLREVTNIRLAKRIYSSLRICYNDGYHSIIDDPARTDRMLAEGVVW